MKTLTTVEQTATNTLKTNDNIRNIGFYNNEYWWVESISNVLTVKKAANFTDAATVVYNTDGYSGDGTTSIICRVFGDEIYAQRNFYRNSIGYGFVRDYSVNGGASWTQVAIGPVGNQYNLNYDVVQFSAGATGTWFLTVSNNGASRYIIIQRADQLAAYSLYSIAEDVKSVETVYAGIMNSDGVYYFAYVDTSDHLKIYSFNGSALTLVETVTTLTIPATFNHLQQQFLRINNTDIVIDQDHIYTRIGSGNWSSYTASGSQSTGIIWDYNTSGQYKVNYLIWNDYIYKVFKGGGLGRILAFVNDARVGWSNWFVDNIDSKIYMLTLTTTTYTDLDVQRKIYAAPTATWRSETAPLENQLASIYTDADVLFFEGFITDYVYDGREYSISAQSPIHYDLTQTVTISFTTQTIKQMRQTLFGYCLFSYELALSSTPSATYTVSFREKRLIDIYKWGDAQEGYQTSYATDGGMYWDTGRDASLAIDDNTALGSDISYHESPTKISKVKLIGKGITSTKMGEPNFATFVDRYSHIDNQTILDNLATSILTAKNKVIIQIKFVIAGDYNEGQYFTITKSRLGLSSDTFYILEARKNQYGQTEIHGASALLFNQDKTTIDSLEGQISDINQNISDVKTTADAALPTTTAASTYVALTGDQTIAGVKTFSSFPITPNAAPTTDLQVANKAYVDAAKRFTPITPVSLSFADQTWGTPTHGTQFRSYCPANSIALMYVEGAAFSDYYGIQFFSHGGTAWARMMSTGGEYVCDQILVPLDENKDCHYFRANWTANAFTLLGYFS